MNNLPRVVVLTGAGISAESGLKTFRDSNGLWENHRVEDVATPDAFARNPSLVYRFYNARRAQSQGQTVKPNHAHHALSSLASKLGNKLTLVTQNVDNLHEQAGSPSVVHMHGELLSARCSESEKRFYWEDGFDDTTPCPCCLKPVLRPDIVWFGEVPMYMEEIYTALSQADIFIAIGTSGQVYPAAGFVQIAKQAGAYCVEANLEPGASNALFDASFTGMASQTVPDITHKIINNSLIAESR